MNIDITDKINVMDIPVCPLCDQPITEMDIGNFTTGYHKIRTFRDDQLTMCLIHIRCANEREKK